MTRTCTECGVGDKREGDLDAEGRCRQCSLFFPPREPDEPYYVP